MRQLRFMLLLLLVTFFLGCGGGSATKPNSNSQKIIQVLAGQGLQTTIGQATITSGVFPTATTVTLKETPAPTVNQPSFGSAQPLLTISADTAPSGGFTVSYPATSSSPVMTAVYEGSELVDSPEVAKQNGQLVVKIDSTNRSSRAVTYSVSLLMGIINHVFPADKTVSLKPIGNNQDNGKTLVFCHGLVQTADDENQTILALKAAGNYGQAFSVGYDWRSPFTEVGTELAKLLNQFPSKTVDCVAYSKGGLCIRQALEKLSATKAVRRVLFLGTPNQGCSLTVNKLYRALALIFLKSRSELPMIFDSNDGAVAELLPSSAHITALNTFNIQQNGKVDYLFVAGSYLNASNDSVVSVDSALMNNNDTIFSQTNGLISRYLINGPSHSSLVKVDNAKTAYAQLITPKSGIDVTIVDNPSEASDATGNWKYRVTITNNTGQDVIIDSLESEKFNRYGDWITNGWYNPHPGGNGAIPQQYFHWDQPLARGQSTSFQISTWTDLVNTPVASAADDRKAISQNWILLGHDEAGNYYETKTILRLTYKGITPAEPHTRAVPAK